MFDEKKATALVARILSLAGGSLEYIKVLKLVYLADRESLNEQGCSISTDRWVSMKFGPVPSNTYRLMHQEDDPKNHPVWRQHIESLADYKIGLKSDPGTGCMSEAELEIIQHIWEAYGRLDIWGPDGLIAYTHSLPEWEQPDPEGLVQATSISLENILHALGKSKEEIDEIMDLERTSEWLEKVLA